MATDDERIETDTLRNLVPLNALTAAQLTELSTKVTLEQLPRGQYLFHEGDPAVEYVYLLRGKVSLVRGGRLAKQVAGGSPLARLALAHHQPRRASARTESRASFLRIDSDLVNSFISWSESSGYEVAELVEEDADDWMARMLHHWVFRRLPAVNVQLVLERMQEIRVDKDEIVIRQGEWGDFYYIVKHGRCRVTRSVAEGEEVTLAELSVGDGFGEMALLANAKRNATVRMLTDGILLRLKVQDFLALIRNPLLKPVNYAAGMDLARKGAVWIDARAFEEYRERTIKGSVNLPVTSLNVPVESLDHGTSYIVFCESGDTSSAAAFLLARSGFDVSVLDGGLESISDQILVRPECPEQSETPEGAVRSEATPQHWEYSVFALSEGHLGSSADGKAGLPETHDDNEHLRAQLARLKDQVEELEQRLEALKKEAAEKHRLHELELADLRRLVRAPSEHLEGEVAREVRLDEVRRARDDDDTACG
jgi:CRP-like cAMP-binding protein